MDLAVLAGRFLLAFVFLSAGISKLVGDQFARALTDYQLLPERMVGPVAFALPRLEVVFGLALGLGVVTSGVAAALAVLLTAFAAAIAYNLLIGRRIDCGCFGGLVRNEISWGKVLQDVALAGIAVAIMVRPPTSLSLSPGGNDAVSNLDAAAMLVIVTTTVVLARIGTEAVALRSAARRSARTMQLEQP